MVTKDTPAVIMEESIKRLAQRMRKDLDEGKLYVDIHYPQGFERQLSREELLFFAALTFITMIAQYN